MAREAWGSGGDYIIEPYASARERQGCPKKILVSVKESAPPGVKRSYHVVATASILRDDGDVGGRSMGGPLGEISAVSQPRQKLLYVRNANVYQNGCGIGTRLYEALAAVACEKGWAFESAPNLSYYSYNFWEKQSKKGRAVAVNPGAYDTSFRIEHPCEHKSLAGLKRRKRIGNRKRR